MYPTHPELDQTEVIIYQKLYCYNIRYHVRNFVTCCDMCQKTRIKICYIIAQKGKSTLWDKFCADLIWSYKICIKDKEPLQIKGISMEYPVIVWF